MSKKYDYLKSLFGEAKDGEAPKALTFDELSKAIDSAGLQLANIGGGEYVTKSEYDKRGTELDGIKAQLSKANETIKSYKDMDIEGIKQAVTDWETKYTADTKALEDKLAQQAKSYAEDILMTQYQFTSTPAKNGILAELRAKEFKLDNGTLLGAKEFLDKLKENPDYKGAFVQPAPDEPKDSKNVRFTDKSHSDPNAGGVKMSLSEMMQAKNADPNFVPMFN